MGTKSRVLQQEIRFLHCRPPPGPELSFPLWGEDETLVREGAFCAMQENPKFVPMARPYASRISIYLFIPSFIHLSHEQLAVNSLRILIHGRRQFPAHFNTWSPFLPFPEFLNSAHFRLGAALK